MSFDLVGYGTPPVEALCEARNRNRIISQVLRSSVAPVGFGVCSGVVSGLGAEPDFLRDALIEWPAEQEVRTFYLVKWRLCDDPEIREKIEVADREVFRRNQDRLRITESLRVKRVSWQSMYKGRTVITASSCMLWQRFMLIQISHFPSDVELLITNLCTDWIFVQLH